MMRRCGVCSCTRVDTAITLQIPGGPTNFGITIADYRAYVKPDATAEDVRNMRVDEAKRIYRKHYWDAQRCDELPAGVDYSLYDYGVNSGIGRSGKVLRRVVGLPDCQRPAESPQFGACNFPHFGGGGDQPVA